MRNCKLILLTISLVCFGFACGTATDTAKTDAPSTPATEASPAAETPAATTEDDSKKEEAPKSDLDPEKIDLEKPIPAGDLKAAVAADKDKWIGKEVSVVGRYGKTTTSKLPEGDKIRVDIQDDKYATVVGCVVKEEVSEDVVKKRDGRVFKGTIKAEVFGKPQLDPCEFVK